MLHKTVEIGKTVIKCNNLFIYSCYSCYQDYLFSFVAKLGMWIATICIVTIGTGILGTIFGIEIVMIKNTSVFIERARDNTYINSSFLDVNQA